ncbi:MAG: transposase, partial [Bdellovibrionales bacterium]|nr:transposase [Bdellovibrionales bacterium]
MGFASISSEFHEYWKESGRKVHGGSHAQNLRKTKRPFDSKKPMHLVLKSERARGTLSMWKPSNKAHIHKIVAKHAARSHVRIYRFSNNGNHLHLAIRAKDKRQFQKFLRSIAGLIARHVLNDKKGLPAKTKFWSALAFT